MPRVPGLKDVAAHAGVSIATVSRVINAEPYVAEAVRQKVAASMAALGYEPHSGAQSLRTGQSQTIGYLVNDIRNPLFSMIARGMDDALQQADYTMFLANSRGDPHHEAAIVRQMQRRRVDGLVLSLSDETDPALQLRLSSVSIPLVLLDREVPGLQPDAVLVDHQQGVQQALAQLVAAGHRRIGLITGSPTTRPGRLIAAAFQATLLQFGLTQPAGYLQIGGFDEAAGEAGLQRLLALAEPPSALIAGGAQISVGVLRAVRQRGLRVPHDLSLVAYDNTDVTELFQPAVTVIARDMYAIGREAAQLILRRLQLGAGASRTVMVPTRLVERESVGRPRLLLGHE